MCPKHVCHSHFNIYKALVIFLLDVYPLMCRFSYRNHFATTQNELIWKRTFLFLRLIEESKYQAVSLLEREASKQTIDVHDKLYMVAEVITA